MKSVTSSRELTRRNDVRQPDESASQLAHLVAAEEASDATVVRLDRDGLVRSWNGAAQRLLGPPLEAVLARPFATFFAEPETWAELFQRVLAGERLAQTHIDMQRPPSLIIPVSMTLVPLRQGSGPVFGCSVVTRDLTEQVFTQQTLAANEDQVRRSEALAGTGRFVIDAANGSTQWSAGMHAIHGTNPAVFQASMSAHVELVHPDDRARVAEAFQRALAGGYIDESDHRIVRPDGQLCWIVLAVEPRHDAHGRPIGLSGVCQDVTARKREQAALQESAELTRASKLAALLTDVAVHANQAGNFADAVDNAIASVCTYMGWPVGHALVLSPDNPKTLVSLGVWHLAEPHRFARFRETSEQVCHLTGQGLPGRTLETGQPVWIRDLNADDTFDSTSSTSCGLAAGFALPILVGTDTVGVLEFFGSDVQEPDETLLGIGSLVGSQLGRVIEREAAEKRLTHQALYDALTGLPNRALLMSRLREGLARAKRNGTRIDVLYLDVDDFKVINDSRGHAAGDEVLSALSIRLGDTVRAGDTLGRLAPSVVARLGGDEFALVLEDCGAPEAVAERLGGLLREPLQLSDSEAFVSVSIGSARALTPGTGTSAEEVLAAANLAMHEAKRAGKGHHVAFDPAMQEKARRRHELGDELHRAVENREFELHYQPIVAMDDGRVVGAEALIRWRHPVRGLVPPNDFIQRAEETGLIVPIGTWVVREACRRAAQWRATAGVDLTIAVNVSGRQLRQSQRHDFVSTVRHALKDAQLEPQRLCLEVTESVLMERAEDAIAMLTELRRDGVEVAIDDFGTGYSSLGALRRLPVNVVKIDRSFVTQLPQDDKDASIAWTIVQLAHRLGMTVVAEGVETAGQHEVLRGNGCDRAQGYLFSRPLDADTFAMALQACAHPPGTDGGAWTFSHPRLERLNPRPDSAQQSR
jgi:diguanylate cyclase (GGDEF)-like protein/PAS domain S-box-containing protein